MKWRLATVVALLLIVLPVPAHAHGSSTVAPSNYRSDILTVEPATPGVSIRVDNGTEELKLTNNGAAEVIVLGYEAEPYLRVGPDGVFVNRNSPAYFLNSDREGGTAPPPDANAQATPEWLKLSDDRTVGWHDHRSHWMAPVLPRNVAAAPDQQHVVLDRWTVQYVVGGTTTEVTGRLLWLPPPSPTPWILGGIALVALFAGLLWRVRNAPAVTLAGTLVIDVVHRVGHLASIPSAGTARAGEGFELLLPSLLAWGAGVHAYRLLRKDDAEAPWFIAFSAVLMLALSGVAQWPVLESSQVPYAFGPTAARVFATVGTALPVALTGYAVVAISRRRRERLADAD